MEPRTDQWLRRERGIAFEDTVFHLAHGGLLDTIQHPNQRQYPGQRLFVTLNPLKGSCSSLRLRYTIAESKAAPVRVYSNAIHLVDRGDFEQFAGTLRIPSKVVSSIFERFSQGHSLMVEELPQSRLPADMQEKVRRIMDERDQRLFGR